MMESIGAAKLANGEELLCEELGEGVVRTRVKTGADSPYGVNNINVIEADLSNPNVYFDVIGAGDYSNELDQVADTCKRYNKLNEDKTALAAVNGDMWMVSYAHARYDMSKVAGSYSQYGLVCKKTMTVPRGFNMYDGEIITTAHMTQETPYEGDFWSFGITTDGELVMGNPKATVKILDKTGETITKADGINRLPADNALVLYTDKGLGSNGYALDDAYEILVETDGDYKVCHGANIKGKVTAIYDESTKENPPKLAENQLLLTARGTRVKKVNEIKVGDEISVEVTVREVAKQQSEQWQKVRAAVGGHIWFVSDGELTGQGAESGYPTTIVGSTKDGKLVLATIDGRQPDFATGTNADKLKQLAQDLDLYNAFLVDGGGSTTMAVRKSKSYVLANRPSDKFSNGNYGAPRAVVNSVIVACVNKDEETKPVASDTVAEDIQTPTDSSSDTAQQSQGKGGSKVVPIAIGAAVAVAAAAGVAVLLGKKKKN